MLDDIDYSDLTSSAQPAEAKPAKKSTISDRKISSKAEKPKPVDVEALTERATQLETGLGAPQIGDPLAEYGLPGIGVLGGLAAAYGLYQASKSKPITGPVIQAPAGAIPAVDYNIPAYMRNPAAEPVATTPAAPTAPAAPDRLQRAAEMIEANRQAGLGGQPMAPVAPIEAAPAAVAPTPMTPDELAASFRGEAPQAGAVAPPPISTPLSSAPVDAPAPLPSASPGSAATEIVADEIKSMMTEADKPVAPEYPKKTTFKSAAEIPPGFEFRPDVGNLDRSMGNILGKEHRENAREMFAGGKKFGQSANLNDDVSRLTTQYFQNLQQQIPETILGRDARKLQNIPSEFGTFSKNTNFGKGVKVGGVAGTLFAISDLANAQTAGQRGMAGANLLEAVLPPAMMMSGAGAGSSTVPSADAAMLLGSPYAQTEIAKKRRQQEEYTRKVGAGRGIAPPSAYMR